ncbi:MAG: hypothetical protein WCF67_00150, partial [Chitinophagaceae bacterium]
MAGETEELVKFRWLFYLLLPAFAIGTCFMLYGDRYLNDWRILVFGTLITAVITFVLSATHITIANFIRSKMQQEDKLVKRLFISAIIYFPITALFVTGIFFGYDAIGLFGYTFNKTGYGWGLFTGFVCD